MNSTSEVLTHQFRVEHAGGSRLKEVDFKKVGFSVDFKKIGFSNVFSDRMFTADPTEEVPI